MSRAPQLSFEILDHIFSFLVPHRETLIACSKDPVLSPIVERYLYYHIFISLGHRVDDPDYALKPNQLCKLISENPRILYYVRILQIHVDEFWRQGQDGSIAKALEEFSKPLFMFPELECIMLTSASNDRGYWWSWSDPFRAALEDCLRRSTIKEIHLTGSNDFPFSIFDNCENIKNLTLSGYFKPERRFRDSVMPRLKSLTLLTHFSSEWLFTWLKLHINELESLKCGLLSVTELPELLEICSETLKKLEIDLEHSPYSRRYAYPTVPNLQQLLIRAPVYQSGKHASKSYLPVAAEAIRSLTSSPRLGHLILEINITFSIFSRFNEIDFSPLAILGAASLSIPRIDLYIYTGIYPAALTLSRSMSLLKKYEDITKSIKEGIIVLHSEETAPDA